MIHMPGVIIVVDPKKEKIALHEAKVLKIPVVAMVDTNCDPDGIEYIIPSNDDSLRTLKLVIGKLGDAVLEGKVAREERIRSEVDTEAQEKRPSRQTKTGSKGTAYVNKPEGLEEQGVESYSATAVEAVKTGRIRQSLSGSQKAHALMSQAAL